MSFILTIETVYREALCPPHLWHDETCHEQLYEYEQSELQREHHVIDLVCLLTMSCQ